MRTARAARRGRGRERVAMGGTARKERRVRCVAGGERGEKKNEEAMGKGPMYYSQPPLWAPTEPSGVQGADIAQMGADGVRFDGAGALIAQILPCVVVFFALEPPPQAA